MKNPMGQTIGFLLYGYRVDNYSYITEYLCDKLFHGIITVYTITKKLK
jgi:hypothetical protein